MAPEMLVISLTIIWSEMIKYSSLWTIVDGVFGYNGKNEDVWDACLVLGDIQTIPSRNFREVGSLYTVESTVTCHRVTCH